MVLKVLAGLKAKPDSSPIRIHRTLSSSPIRTPNVLIEIRLDLPIAVPPPVLQRFLFSLYQRVDYSGGRWRNSSSALSTHCSSHFRWEIP
jgi:hypothetical protein